MIRRAFVKDAALAAAAASGLTGGLGALSGLLAQPRPSSPRSRLLLGSGQARPFNMICLGDSVMWGQGLEESTKFTSLVKTWLESKLPGRTVNRFVFARSGATIAPDDEVPDESRVAAWMNNPGLSEVPCSWPWVQQQVVVARQRLVSQQIAPEAVDLVLLDGGINDLGVFESFLVATNDPEDIRRKSATFCGDHMADVLDRVRTNFPYAKIVVTGYFPIVSMASNLDALTILLSLVFPGAGVPLNNEIQSKLVTLSDTWYKASNEDLARAVASFNNKWASNPTTNTRPAAFARIPWGAEHSYAAPSSRLYLAGLPNDPVYWQRLDACAAAGPGKAGSPLCLDAKIGHPNASGAAAYAAACQAQLMPSLVGWGGAKLMSACVEMDAMPTAGVATTLLVHATESGSASKTVRGTVRVGGQTFATDTPVPLTLCTRRTTYGGDPGAGREREKDPRERVTAIACAPMIVSAPGYVDVVIKDYLSAVPVP
jgi:lysophospholipase L1-like esterase